jgi:hypothetical protein
VIESYSAQELEPSPDANAVDGGRARNTDWDIDDGASSESSAKTADVQITNPQSLHSFWKGIAGLAVLAHMAILASMLFVGVCDRALSPYMLRSIDQFNFNTQSSRATYQQWFDMQEFEFNCLRAMVSGYAWISVFPILLWRGSLGKRFAIATILFTCILFLFDQIGGYSLRQYLAPWAKLNAILAVLACWAALPLLLSLRVIKASRLLQEFMTYGTMALAACLSIATMDQPSAIWIVAMIATYGFVVLLSLSLRHFRSSAMLEALALPQSISRTSTGTLIALMGVGAIFSMVLTAWTTILQRHESVAVVQTAVVGIVIAGISASFALLAFKIFRPRWYVGLYWIVSVSLGVYLIHIGKGIAFRGGVQYDFTLFQLAFEIVFGATSLLTIFVFAKVCRAWLGYCGWTLGHREA